MFIENRQKISKGFDVQLIILYIIFVMIGWFSIFSSSYDPVAFNGIFNLDTPYGRQLVWIGTSILIAIVILFLDSRIFQNYAYHIYLTCLILLILVLFVGTEISGAKAWIKIGPFSLQPSEFMKMATALALAKFLNEGKTGSEKRNTWLLCFVIILIPVLVIMLQKDTGSALVYASFIVLFYREGMSGRFFIWGAFIAVIAIVTLYLNELYAVGLLVIIFLIYILANKNARRNIRKPLVVLGIGIAFVFMVNVIYENVFEPHQKQRIDSLLGKTSDPKGIDFNLNQSKIAIGSGGFAGKGFLKGTQTKFNFVPEQSTDFIFCSIGEEWGFLGSLAIVSLFVYLVFRIIWLAEKHRNPFVRYYGYGIAGIFFFHFLINIGMTIGLVPIIGIPLPFISYGGSSLWAFTTMLFVFINLNDA
ncbi:rod shape-determining protein RodA [Bacteroidales bacterium OttesenSCG-928-B11]|nr:rod shape-determining protein RodA [Bacteroidales bacterium OttesenSCG-928-E04]MDL2311767.1 rod shape-determining protein RodA [Bacteroidales bacterium OttesenSCG-928-B11]MDL2325473.1 rod shape-determining protein RodA [Bacteroidales bacterium OttesenSCG-928-A14]